MDWDDGRWLTLDVVQLRLLAPQEWEGTTIFVSIHPDAIDSMLRKIGTRCSFSIPAELLTQDRDVFEGALLDLKTLEQEIEPPASPRTRSPERRREP
jgi:hypothetical protein